MQMFGKHELEETLERIDEEAFLELGEVAVRLPVVIVGGSAFMLRDLTKRPATHDIDILQADTRIKEVLKRYKLINSAVAAYMDQIPYNFEDRLYELNISSKAIRWLTPSLEDLVVMKLYAWRPNDIDDVTNEAVLSRIDWELLDKLVHDDNEAKASALSERRYNEMLSIYEGYVERYAC